MRYSLDLRFIGSQSYLDSIKIELPAKNDSIVDSDLYDAPTVGKNMDGQLQLSGMIRFIKSADRATIKDNILSLAGSFNGAKIGSRMALHTCYHDETPPKACTEKVIWEVTQSGTTRNSQR